MWAQGNAPYSGTWNALEYPSGHPYDGSKLDLAFVVNGEPDKDWGDAPDSLANPRYPTLDDHDGARHVILEGLHMGTTVDYEIDGQPDTTATGDDSAGSDDEDGVRIPVLARGATVTIEIDVELGPYSKRAYVDAWLDCNQDDDWSDVGEQVLTSEPVEEGENEITVTIPTSTQTGTTFMRFRLSLAGGLAPTGEAPDGEVEDYEVIVAEPYDYGDAPEGALCYLDGTIGEFPTCTGGTAGFIRHAESDAWFGPMVDFEGDGNAGACALFDWGDYDQDECAEDGDAGLITPTAYRLTGPGASNPCVGMDHTMLGCSCEIAQWGSSIDINVHNWLPDTAYVNMLVDWDEDGTWSGASECPEGSTPEHVLVDFPVPKDYDGPLSALSPPDFRIGENLGLLWTRISITECPIGTSDWDGSGVFEAGETEDYLLHVATCDYGDAPEPYPTLKADNGPRHVISGTVRLGDLRDPELDGQPDPDALGDDHNDGIDDEDGVDFVTPFVPG